MQRYKATVEAVTPGGYFVVYDEWGNREEVRGFRFFQRSGDFVDLVLDFSNAMVLHASMS